MRVKARMPVSFLYFFALEFKIMDHRMRVKKKKISQRMAPKLYYIGFAEHAFIDSG